MVEKVQKREEEKVPDERVVTESTCEKVSGMIMDKIIGLAKDVKEIKDFIVGDLKNKGLVTRVDDAETEIRKLKLEAENKIVRNNSIVDRVLLIVISLILAWIAMKIGLTRLIVTGKPNPYF